MKSEIRIKTRNGDPVEVAADDIGTLESEIAGDLLLRSSNQYEKYRALWNGTIESRPAMIALCETTRDVVRIVKFAREADAEVAIRAGGHNVAGTSSVHDGVVIDLRRMNRVTVDIDSRVADVQGGATLGDVDRATQRYGLITPSGFISDTGIAGLTLRGGLGHTMRRFGMSCDNLLAAEIVTSEGDVLRVDEESTPEIMWALRGGPLDLGVVTSFRFRLHRVGPRVRLLMGVYPRQVGVEVNRMLRDQMRDAPPELGLISFYGSLPDDKELPEPVRDRDAIVLLGMYTGPEPDADEVLAPFLEHPDLLADLGGWMDYTEAQQALDEEYPDGMRYYWKSLYLDELTEAVLQKLHRLSGEMPSPLSTLDVWSLGGAIDDVDPRTSCFPMRNASHMIAIEANWKSPEDDEANKAWARAVFDELEPHSTGGIYLNFPGDRHERADAAESVYGAAHDRLLRVKRNLDPIGMF